MDFDAASVECIALVLGRRNNALIRVDRIDRNELTPVGHISAEHSRSDSLYQISIGVEEREAELMRFIEDNGTPLSDICEIKDGVNPGRADFRQVLLGTKDDDNFKPLGFGKPEYLTEVLAKKVHFNPDIHNPTCEGADIEALAPMPPAKTYLVYSEAIAYLERFFVPNTRWSAQLRDRTIFEQGIKILSRQTANTIIATVDTDRRYPINNVHITYANSNKVDLYLIAALLNSSMLRWYYRKKTGETGKTFPQVHIYSLKKLPIPDLVSVQDLDTLRSELQKSVSAKGWGADTS